MPEVSLRLSGLSALEGLAEIEARLADLSPVTAQAGELLRSSVLRNFGEQGRPEKWRPLQPETATRKGSSLILIDTGRLAGSISVKAGRDSVEVFAPVPYARAHHEGDPARGLPARPFLIVQDEDVKTILAAIENYLSH